MSSEGKTRARFFVPRPGQVDLRKAKWCPCIVVVVRCGDEFLVLQRSEEVTAFQGLWSGVAGFLDDDRSLKEKVLDEIQEELGLVASEVSSIVPRGIFHNEAPELGKVFIVHPVLVWVRTKEIRLDWEAQDFRWLKTMSEATKLPLAPGFGRVLIEVGVR